MVASTYQMHSDAGLSGRCWLWAITYSVSCFVELWNRLIADEIYITLFLPGVHVMRVKRPVLPNVRAG